MMLMLLAVREVQEVDETTKGDLVLEIQDFQVKKQFQSITLNPRTNIVVSYCLL